VIRERGGGAQLGVERLEAGVDGGGDEGVAVGNCR